MCLHEMSSVSLKNWNEICRICLDRGRLLPIFGATIRGGSVNRTVNDQSDSIMKYSNVRLEKNDGLPQNMCYGCLFLLKSAIQFKTLCERSDVTLKTMLSEGRSQEGGLHWDIASGKVVGTKIENIETIPTYVKDGKTVEHQNKKFSNLLAKNGNSMLLVEPPKGIKIPTVVVEQTDIIRFSSPIDDDHSSKDGFPGFQDETDNLTYLEGENKHDIKANDTDNASTQRTKQYNRSEKTYLKMINANKKMRLKRNNTEKQAEFCAISEKVSNLVGCRVAATNASALQRLVVARQQPRNRVIDHEFQEKSRSSFTTVVHPGKGRLLQCNVCSKIIKAGSAHNHAQKHLGYKIICEVCGKGFVSNFGLAQHQMTRHGKEKNLSCQYCSYKTGNRFELSVHERSHTGERPFVCDLCGKSFFRRLCMVKHMMLHANIRPHKCHLCPKSFVHVCDLRAHNNAAHDRRYVYKCEVCDLSYAKAGSVRKHLTAQHSVPREQQGKIPRIDIG